MTTQNASERANQHAGEWAAVRPLAEGPIDVVGDVHGEIDALRTLLGRLGYGRDRRHPQGRTLAFVGDLIDRGPDSAAVVWLVRALVERGLASVVMGNHDLNAIAGKQKTENTWLFDHGPVRPTERKASPGERDEVLAFLRALPLALERADLRVVHAAWNSEALAALSGATGAVQAMAEHKTRLASRAAGEPDPIARNLVLQNENPVKHVTSGPEERAPEPFFAGGKMRSEARSRWWNSYTDGPTVVFGHYWRIPVQKLQRDDALFDGAPLHGMLGNTMCIDYSVGSRWLDRQEGRNSGPFTGRLAALRWPERELVFDDGERQPVTAPAESATR